MDAALLRMGCVASDTLLSLTERLKRWRTRFCAIHHLAVAKECLDYSVNAPTLEAAVAMEDRNLILTTRTNDVRGGIAAFLERRDPQYEDA